MLIEAINWVKVAVPKELRQGILNQLRLRHLELEYVKKSLDQNPTVAIYGPSQVGKSYLVNVLLQEGEKGLEIPIPGSDQRINLISDILQPAPAGVERESSGIVTRFTSNDIHNTPRGFKFHLFDESDLVNMILASYYLNNSELNGKEIDELRELGDSRQNELQTFLDGLNIDANNEELVCSLRLCETYCSRTFNNVYYAILSEKWQDIYQCYDQLTLDQKVDLLSFFWNNNQFYSDLFRSLLILRKQLNNSNYVFSNQDIYLEHTVMGVDRLRNLEGFLLNQNLRDNDGNKINNLSVVKEDGQQLDNVNKLLLSYLVQEAIIYIPNLGEIDYLDFPGGRNNAAHAEIENYGEELIRGKVKYLFQKYRDRYAFDNLVWCAEVNTLQNTKVGEDIKPWVDKYLGNSHDLRNATLTKFSEIINLTNSNPLHYVMTKYNKVLKGGDNPVLRNSSPLVINDYVEIWHTNLATNFIEHNPYKFLNSWRRENEPFKNVYFLRDPNFSRDVFNEEPVYNNVDDDYGINNSAFNYEDRLIGLKAAFMENEDVQKYVNEPTLKWEESSIPGKFGGELIRRDLQARCRNELKEYIRFRELKQRLVNSKNSISVFSLDQNEDELQKTFDQNMFKAHFTFVGYNNENGLGSLLKKFLIKEDEITRLFFDFKNDDLDVDDVNTDDINKLRDFLGDSGMVNSNNATRAEMENFCNNTFGPSWETLINSNLQINFTELPFENIIVDESRTDTFVRILIKRWREHTLNFTSEDDSLQAKLEFIAQIFIRNYNDSDFRISLTQNLEDSVNKEKDDQVGRIASNMINDFMINIQEQVVDFNIEDIENVNLESHNNQLFNQWMSDIRKRGTVNIANPNQITAEQNDTLQQILNQLDEQIQNFT